MSKLEDVIEVTIGEDTREIFMSYGLLNELSKIAGSPEVIAAVAVDAELRDNMMIAVLAERKKSGKIVTPIEDLDEVEISYQDAEKLLKWALEHTMGFFMRSLENVAEMTESHQEVMAELMSSLDGQLDSASPMPSAGSSTSPQVG